MMHRRSCLHPSNFTCYTANALWIFPSPVPIKIRHLGRAQTLKNQVHALPTVLVYKNGKPVTDLKGAFPEAHFKKFLDTL